jgi:hypothetical protein
MVFDNSLTDGKPQARPHPLRLCGEEGLEELIQLMGGRGFVSYGLIDI